MNPNHKLWSNIRSLYINLVSVRLEINKFVEKNVYIESECLIEWKENWVQNEWNTREQTDYNC